MCSEFIYPCSGGIAIITNNVPNPSDLSIIEKYFKSVKGINSNDIPSPRLPRSKSYLKITSLPYLQANGNKITSENVTDFMKHIDLFKNVSLVSGTCRAGAEWPGMERSYSRMKGIWQQKMGEQPWPQLVRCASIDCRAYGCIFQEDWIVARSLGEEWYRLIGVRIGQGEDVNDFNLRTKELGCNY